MNWDEITGKWNQLKGSARAEWAKFTDQELDAVQGQHEKLVGLLQEKYGRTKEEAEQEIDRWVQKVS
ncbi:CsbD family protein [uncultured Roseovarius sp.]|uniref:CsbD family protein n=1 Tax=uncultured Roseovarius sp. TaxID=293344 RepID=UPI0025F30B72|nr:CsbD family protein [uncultured Roseovarius sp.]